MGLHHSIIIISSPAFLAGRNFGLKSGVPIHKENEVPFGPETGGNGEEVLPRQSPGRKKFYSNLISADRLCRQQIPENSSSFHHEKWGTVPQSKSGSTGTFRTPVKYAYAS